MIVCQSTAICGVFRYINIIPDNDNNNNSLMENRYHYEAEGLLQFLAICWLISMIAITPVFQDNGQGRTHTKNREYPAMSMVNLNLLQRRGEEAPVKEEKGHRENMWAAIWHGAFTIVEPHRKTATHNHTVSNSQRKYLAIVIKIHRHKKTHTFAKPNTKQRNIVKCANHSASLVINSTSPTIGYYS